MDPIAHIVRELEEIKRRMRRMMFHGLVTDVDAEKRLVRVSDGTKDEQGQEVKTDWLPWAELAGGLKTLPEVNSFLTTYVAPYPKALGAIVAGIALVTIVARLRTLVSSPSSV